MGTMRKLFTEKKGISLILLIIIILGVGILASGLVSFIGSKLRGYPLEVKSYQALNLANAGVEFAIRYVHERRDAFFQDPKSVIPPPPDYKSGKLDGGYFEISYDPEGNVLISRGIKDQTKREVKVKNFTGYIQGGVSLVPGLQPYRGGGVGPGQGEDPKKVFVPLFNNLDRPIYIFKIHINIKDQPGSNRDYIRTIAFRKEGIETIVYSYPPDQTCRYESSCPPCGIAPCKNLLRGIEIPEPGGQYGDATLIFNVFPKYYVLQTGISTEILEFSHAAVKGRYNLKIFWADNPSLDNPQVSILSFDIGIL